MLQQSRCCSPGGLVSPSGRWKPPRFQAKHVKRCLSSLGAPDLVFEQEVADPTGLEQQIKKVTENREFRQWAGQVAGLLAQSFKRELYQVNHTDSQ